MRGHEEYKGMLAAHVLGALEGAEARELEEHLATCEECRAEQSEWQDTAAALAHTAPPIEPPVELRSRLLASVRAESSQKLARPIGGRESGEKIAGDGESTASSDRSNVVPLAKPARRSMIIVSRSLALAASVAFVAIALSLVLLWSRYSATRQELSNLSEQLNRSQAELVRERELLAREREARELIAAPEARMTALSGTEEATSARARIVYDRETGRAMLIVYDLPPAPPGKAYQLWFIAHGKPPMPGQVFNVDASGRAEMRDQMPAEGRNATIFAVTLEPSNGVPAPTGPKVLLGAAS